MYYKQCIYGPWICSVARTNEKSKTTAVFVSPCHGIVGAAGKGEEWGLSVEGG